MSLIKSMRRQTAVYWASTSPDPDAPAWADQVEVLVRWEDQAGGGEGPEEFAALAYVDRDMRPGDYLMLGTLADAPSADPRAEKSWEVKSFEKLPNLKVTEYLRTVQLVPSFLALIDRYGRGSEAVTYKRVTASSVSAGGVRTTTTTDVAVAAAVRGTLETKDVAVSRARLKGTDASWAIPKSSFAGEPGLEDWVVDAHGTRWNVVSWEESSFRSWWSVLTRKGG